MIHSILTEKEAIGALKELRERINKNCNEKPWVSPDEAKRAARWITAIEAGIAALWCIEIDNEGYERQRKMLEDDD